MRSVTFGILRHAILSLCAAAFVVVEASYVFAQEEDGDRPAAQSEEGDKQSSGEEEAPKKKVVKPKVVGEDPRGASDLTVCSQNLKLFGSYSTLLSKNPKYTRSEHTEKVAALGSRFVKAGCDVIALQEVMGANEKESKAAAEELIGELRKVTNRIFVSRVAPPVEGGMTLGYLIAEDRGSILNTFSYEKVELPKLVDKQRPRLFLRTPMEIQLSVPSKGAKEPKVISIVNFHFKSKRGGAADPTGLEWETYRMEMAEALRRIVESRHKNSFASGESLLILLGDRNGNYDVASARILEGSLVLSNFKKDGGCRLSKRGVPLCKSEISLPQRLFSVFARNERVQSLPGTFTYQGEYSWLDDILMPTESLPYAWRTAYSESEYDSGVVYSPKSASDHAMVYVKLNW